MDKKEIQCREIVNNSLVDLAMNCPDYRVRFEACKYIIDGCKYDIFIEEEKIKDFIVKDRRIVNKYLQLHRYDDDNNAAKETIDDIAKELGADYRISAKEATDAFNILGKAIVKDRE